VKNIEIPYKKDRNWKYRALEILPGALSWLVLFLPLILSLINVTFASFFILAYLLVFFVRALGVNFRTFQGYSIMEKHKQFPWRDMLDELEEGSLKESHMGRPDWHKVNVAKVAEFPLQIRPRDIINVIIIATYNEARAVVEPTIQSIIASNYDMKKVILVLAYEGRAGEVIQKQSEDLVRQYSGTFMHAWAVKHPADLPGEIRGKGGNITYAARILKDHLEQEKINPLHVLVTTLDADNRPDKNYLPALTYMYAIVPDPLHISIQPISIYNNNIWDAPAPMRVMATGNTYFHITQSNA
jgi:hypothetical protein